MSRVRIVSEDRLWECIENFIEYIEDSDDPRYQHFREGQAEMALMILGGMVDAEDADIIDEINNSHDSERHRRVWDRLQHALDKRH